MALGVVACQHLCVCFTKGASSMSLKTAKMGPTGFPPPYRYLMAAANAADPKTESNRLGGSGRVGPSRAE